IIGHDSLDGVFIAEFQADPQSIQLWPREKYLAVGLEIVGEFTHKINTPDILYCKISMLPLWREQLERLRIAEFAGIQITAFDAAIEESHVDFLVRGGWSSCSHGGWPAARALRVDSNYVMLSGLSLSSVYF